MLSHLKSATFSANLGQRLFWGAAFLNLMSEVLNFSQGIYLSKPLLMPALGLSLLAPARPLQQFQIWILCGLGLSWLGDVLLMFAPDGGEPFFLAGLVSFLLAHLSYLTAFWGRSLGRGLLRDKPWLIFPFIGYFLLLNTWWWEELGGLRTHVILYSMVITAMAISALHLKGQIEEIAWKWLLGGALLFVVSDTLLAINKFVMPLQGVGFWIMASYILAQYGIVRGSR